MPTLYRKPNGHKAGALVVRMDVRSPTGKLRDEDRYLEASEESLIAREAAQAGQEEVIERASRGERISW